MWVVYTGWVRSSGARVSVRLVEVAVYAPGCMFSYSDTRSGLGDAKLRRTRCLWMRGIPIETF